MEKSQVVEGVIRITLRSDADLYVEKHFKPTIEGKEELERVLNNTFGIDQWTIHYLESGSGKTLTIHAPQEL